MKKILSLLATAALLGGGLVAGASTAEAGAPYPGTVNTTCQASGLRAVTGRPVRAKFRAFETNGNGAPHGSVKFTYTRNGNSRSFTESYTGPDWHTYSFGKMHAGKYNVRVKFNTKPADSVYKDCSTSFTQTVRRRA